MIVRIDDNMNSVLFENLNDKQFNDVLLYVHDMIFRDDEEESEDDF